MHPDSPLFRLIRSYVFVLVFSSCVFVSVTQSTYFTRPRSF